MTTFAVQYTYVDDVEAITAHRPEHRAFLGRLAEEGICLVAGAYAPGEAPGALLIFRHDDRDALAALLTEDPFQREGIVTGVTITAWGPAVGPYASDLA